MVHSFGSMNLSLWSKKVRNYKSLTSSIVKPVMSAIISNAKP